MLLRDLMAYLEKVVPLRLQESYDNSGLIVGNPEQKISSALICLDVTKEILSEAKKMKCNLIISHHPVLFKPLNRLTGASETEQIIIEAIKNSISIYALHTNLDKIGKGVSFSMCKKLNLNDCKILYPEKSGLKKLVAFIPADHAEKVRYAIFNAGAGHIGNYDMCSFNVTGKGSFRALDGTNPYVGKQNEIHFEDEVRLETILPDYIVPQVIREMIKAHPYEEVAYDIYPLENANNNVGLGMVGALKASVDELVFLKKVKKVFNGQCIRYTQLLNKKIKTVAVCGGSGSSLISSAIRNKADIFITADIKYHQFFDAGGKIVLADIGHYESEQYAKEIICDIIKKKFPNFALHLSEINTNPINYL